MKILMFGHKRIPSREGGVEIVVEALSTRMAALGHQVICCNRRGHYIGGAKLDGISHGTYRGVQLYTVPTVDFRGLAAVSSSFFASLFSALSDVRVVHIHGEGPAFFCWLPRIFGKKVVVTVHGLDWQREKWRQSFGRIYIRWGEKMAVRFAHRIIVLSENARQYFLETYGRETVLIPNSVEQPQHRPAKKITERFGLLKDSYILFLGRLVPEKGVHDLIEAYKQLKNDKKLVIAGSSSNSQCYVKRLKELAGSDENILFTGFVQREILEELYSNAWVYVLPTCLEGMPLSLLEAMSYGNCCVVSDLPECRETAGDNAIFIPKGDVQALKNCLQSLPAEMRTDMKVRAAAHTRGRYSWEEITDQTLTLYREVTEE